MEVERIVSSDCMLIGACALHTHYHLILETAAGVLSRALKQANHRYALTYNARYGRRGHAFGLPGRFAFADPSLVLGFFNDSVEQLRVFVETPWESDKGAKPKAGSDTASRSQTPIRICP